MSEQRYLEIGNDLAATYGTTLGKMFGKQCLKVGGKAFAAFYNEEMVFKLGQNEIIPLIKKYKGSKNWDPSGKGRPMKDWLQIPVHYQDDWPELAKQSMEFVVSTL